jgi:hypothetical protein
LADGSSAPGLRPLGAPAFGFAKTTGKIRKKRRRKKKGWY